MLSRNDVAARLVIWMLASWALACGDGRCLQAQVPLRQTVDELISAGWKSRSVTPAELSSDAEFLRRVTLDLSGTVPTTAATRAFLNDPASDKREKLVDQLLASPEYARHMQLIFDAMLLERQHANYVTEAEWAEYLRESFAANKPWDQLVRELIGVDGTDPKVRPAMRFQLVRTLDSYRVLNPNAITRDVGRLFLGINLQCAQCHDHPTIKDYHQADYFGIYAFFNRSSIFMATIDSKSVAQFAESAEGGVTFTSVFDKEKKSHTTNPHLPGRPEITEPTFEKGKEYTVAPATGVRTVPIHSRRTELARTLPAVDHAAFNRNIANRLWCLMLGRGLVHPVDLQHAANPASHPELLDVLGKRFAEMRYDIKAFLRELALSRTYQLSSIPAAGTTVAPPESFATARLKPIGPEQFAMTMLQATGMTDIQRTALGDKLTAETLYATQKGHFTPFVTFFASPPGQAEGAFQSSLEQGLFLGNGDSVRSWLGRQPGNLVDRLANLPEPLPVAEELYLSVYSRRPSSEENAEVTEYLKDRTADRVDALQELVWSLLTSVEFRFNH
ncbi:MAG: hypothetical protein JWN70_2072 [Planctomycetaceae bacterium]|nr:hypothetical protein [Planctomycetaceae bacterium]